MNFIQNNPNNLPNDVTLLTLASQGDKLAFGQLYNKYMHLVYGVCLKYLQNEVLAQDAVLNIYEVLSTKIVKQEITNFTTWLHTVSKNHCLMYLRSPKNKAYVEIKTDSMYFEADTHLTILLQKEVTYNNLAMCIEKLNTEQAETLKLFYYQKKCYNEIETITGLQHNKVRSALQNARRNIKICMENNNTSNE